MSPLASRKISFPPVIGQFLDAVNRHDMEVVVSSFSSDAIVNDQLDEHRGAASIREWAERDVIGAALMLDPITVTSQYSCSIVTAEVDGTFDKRGLPHPLVYRFYFVIAGEKIVLLVVLRDEP